MGIYTLWVGKCRTCELFIDVHPVIYFVCDPAVCVTYDAAEVAGTGSYREVGRQRPGINDLGGQQTFSKLNNKFHGENSD